MRYVLAFQGGRDRAIQEWEFCCVGVVLRKYRRNEYLNVGTWLLLIFSCPKIDGDEIVVQGGVSDDEG